MHQETKRHNVVECPFNCFTFLIYQGDLMLIRATFFSKFTSIPREDTIYHNNFPDVTSKTHFFKVKTHFIMPYDGENLFQIRNMVFHGFDFYHHFIHIHFLIPTNFLFEHFVNQPIMSQICIFQLKRHSCVAKCPFLSDE